MENNRGNKIFYVMGKSASGKDTIYKLLLEKIPWLKTVTLYTTRPARSGERDGVEYFFTSEEKLQECRQQGKLIESRTYSTIHGPWTYFTVDDGQFELADYNYLMIGTLESYSKMQRYFGMDVMKPIYIHVDDGLRLERALKREQMQKEPKYKELCRRYLADEDDFSEENLRNCNIVTYFENRYRDQCLDDICVYMKGQ